MSSLPRTLARVLAAGLGVPALSCLALVAAAPSLLDDDLAAASVARAVAASHAARSLAVMVLAASVATVAVLRSARAVASTRDRRELLALPRALSLAWGALAALRFAEGALSDALDPRGTLALAASAVMSLAAVAMHPALRLAVRPALDAAALPAAPPSASERLALRTAIAVGAPCGAAALLAILALGAQGRHHARSQRERAAATWSAALAVSPVRGERREGPALAARVLAAAGALTPPEGDAGGAGLPSRPWAVTVALAAGILGALIGRRVGRDAAEDLRRAAARIDALSGGALGEDPLAPTETAAGAAPEVTALIEPLNALAASLSKMAADQGRAVSARREAARLRSLVFAGVSHDLRGPLNAVLGFAGLLEMGADGPLTEGQRESVEALTRGGRELLRLVDDLLDAARVEAGRMTVDARPIDLAELVADAVREADARVRTASAASPPTEVEQLPEVRVLADATRAPQALGALLAYARLRPGAQGGGHVSLRITAVDASVTLRVHSPGATPDAEALAGVLEPFDLPPQGARARAGLGLAVGVASRVVALQGGAVTTSAAPEGGLLFSVTLRRAPRR